MRYIITFNNGNTLWSEKDIHDYITTLKGINDWWHYLPNTYIVSTSLTSKDISSAIIQKFQGLLFVVAQINLNDINGLLPKDAWNWVAKENKKVVFKIKPTTTSSSYGSLLDNYLLKDKIKTTPILIEELLGLKKK